MTLLTLRVVRLADSRPAFRGLTAVRLLLVYVMTIGRLGLAVGACLAVVANVPWVAIALVGIFVFVDIYDGVVARHLGLETGLRRGLDGTVDKLSIHLVAAVACITIPGGLIIWLAILLRDIVQALVGLVVLERLRVVAAGAKWHRSFTTSVAIWGVAVISIHEPVWFLAVPMLILGALTLIDYIRQCRLLLRLGSLQGRFTLETDTVRDGGNGVGSE